MKFQIPTTALILASTAAASPAADTKGTFHITNFNWGCTVGCSWLFNVTDPYSTSTHRPVTKPVQCQGTRGSQTGYVDCTPISEKQTIRAYIGETGPKGGAKLFLEYEDRYPKLGSYYIYSGETIVYSQTGDQAGKQKKWFDVVESKAVGVA